MSNVHCIYNVHDVIEHCNAPLLKLAVIILEIINEVFKDVQIDDKLYSLVSTKEQVYLVSKVTASLQTNVNPFENLGSENLHSTDSEELLLL